MKQTEPKPFRKLRVRTWLMIGLISFVIIGLILLLVSQTFFLDDFYEFMKIRGVKSAANEIVDTYGTDSLSDCMQYWNIKEDCEIYVVNALGQVVASRGVGEEAERLSTGELRAYYGLAVSSEDGTVFSQTEIALSHHEKSPSSPPKSERPGGERVPPRQDIPEYESDPIVGETSERVVYAVLTEPQGNMPPDLVLIVTVITPLNATLRVLQVQFLIAIVVFVLVAAWMAWFMGRSIAAPIVRINKAAKGLATGTYQPPKEGSYREIAELGDTLTKIDGELRKSEQLQRDLIANVSHDMRTPLTMIIGYSEAIRDLPGEDSAENIQVVIDEAERLSRLVSDVLDLSKIQSGVEQIELTPTKLTETLRDVVSRVGTMTQQEGYTVELVADEDVTVSADDVRLSQIIYNLLINALAHTGEDHRVTVAQTVINKTVRVSFADSGAGIPEKELSNIWLRYYQVHSHERRQTMNSGLGLSIVYALVRLHGGTCGVDSAPGRGSTFWFELPLL